MKKKPATQKRGKKGAVKDLEPKANPKGGLNFAVDYDLSSQKVSPSSLNFLKIEYKK
jgi:hypothetical protein